MTTVAQPQPRELVAEVEQRLEQIETLEDAGARETAMGAIRALLGLYEAGLERMLEEIGARDDGQLAAAFAGDELVAHLLLLHGLHPVPLEQRVLDGLAEVRPYLESHGGDVELVAIDGAAVRLRMQGSCNGCPSSAMTLKLAIENALAKAAPEIEQVIAEEPEPEPGGLPLLQIEPAGGSVAHAAAPAALLQIEVAPGLGSTDGWTMAGGLPELNGGGMTVKRIGGQEVLFLRLGESLYAYRPRCPACGERLDTAQLTGPELTCGGCAHRYDALRAGRCLDAPQLNLEPVPLLVGDDGLVRLALALPA